MLTPKLYQALGWCFKYSLLLRIIPYKWDRSRNSLNQISSKTDISIWFFANFVLLSHQIFLFIRLYDCIGSRDPTLTFYVGESVHVLGFLLGTILQITLIMKKNEYANFFNHFMKYFQKLQGNYCSNLQICRFTLCAIHFLMLYDLMIFKNGSRKFIPNRCS